MQAHSNLQFDRLRLLAGVCRNEAIPSYRDFEEMLVPVARGLLAGWMDDTPACAWRPALERLAAGMSAPVFAPFFHGHPVPFGPFQDDVARAWGLAQGLNVARLWQALEPPYLC